MGSASFVVVAATARRRAPSMPLEGVHRDEKLI
jgi:hypothetical protein